jgi:4-amino-4-deoxy-L-arabinose transferase-like glycosyltransferase
MKKIIKDWKYTVAILFGLLLIGFVIRLINLTILPVFADEAIYIRWAQVMVAEPTLRFLPLSDGKQPLYMWVLMLLVRKMADPLLIGRLVSVLSSVGTMLGIFILSFILFKNKLVSLIATLLWVLSPFAFFFDRMALVDSVLTLFGVWTAVFSIITAKTTRLDMALFTGFSLGFALLTKSPSIFFVLLLPLAVLFANFSNLQKERGVKLAKLAALLITSYGVGFAMYSILRLGPNFHLIGMRNIDYVWPITRIFTNPLDPFKPHFDRSMQYLWELGPGSIFIMLILAFAIIKGNFKKILFLLAWGFIPIIINSEYAKVLTARYILFTLPFIFILASSGFTTDNKITKKILYSALGIFIIHSLWINYLLITNPEKAPLSRTERSGYLEEWTAGTGIREASEILKIEAAKLPAGQQIVVGTEGYFGTLPDGLQIYMQGVPNVLVIGVGLDIGKIPQPLVESKKAGNKTYLVANSSRLNFNGDFSEYGLRVVASYKKADREDHTREIVQHGLFDTFYLLEVENLP